VPCGNPKVALSHPTNGAFTQSRFDQLRARIPKNPAPVRIETRYVILPDPRVNAAWKSLLLPGWEQRSKGQKSKGRVLTLSAAALAGTTVATHFLRQRAEEDYLAATDESVIKQRYETFNRYHPWRNSLALALGIVWGASVLDALIVPVRPVPPAMGMRPTGGISSQAVFLSLQISF